MAKHWTLINAGLIKKLLFVNHSRNSGVPPCERAVAATMNANVNLDSSSHFDWFPGLIIGSLPNCKWLYSAYYRFQQTLSQLEVKCFVAFWEFHIWKNWRQVAIRPMHFNPTLPILQLRKATSNKKKKEQDSEKILLVLLGTVFQSQLCEKLCQLFTVVPKVQISRSFPSLVF